MCWYVRLWRDECILCVEYFWCDFSIQLDWSLALSGSLVVALDDSSLIQVNVETHKPNITVQGRRDTILSPVQVRLVQFVVGRVCNSLSIEQKLCIFMRLFEQYKIILCVCVVCSVKQHLFQYFNIFMSLFYKFTTSSLNKSLNFWEKKSCLAGIAKKKRVNSLFSMWGVFLSLKPKTCFFSDLVWTRIID